MSEQHSEPVSGQAGTDMAKSEPVMAAADVEAGRLSPDQEETTPKADAPSMDAPPIVPPPIEAAKSEPTVEPVNMDVPKVETGSREEPRFPGSKLMIMAPGNRTWDHEEAASKPAAEQPAKSSGRFAAMAAVIALATVAGAIGGALATAGFSRVATPAVASVKETPAKDSALEASIARIDSEISALKASVEQGAKTGQAQFNRANDRLEKVEKAQAEPMTKLAKLSEAVDKLRTTPQPQTTTAAATPVTARETTGTVAPQATAAAAAPAVATPKTEVGRLPVVEGWALRDVGNGGALIEGRGGIYEVYAGDPVPGLGRVDAIRRQDGHWVVVTSRGLIVSR